MGRAKLACCSSDGTASTLSASTIQRLLTRSAYAQQRVSTDRALLSPVPGCASALHTPAIAYAVCAVRPRQRSACV